MNTWPHAMNEMKKISGPRTEFSYWIVSHSSGEKLEPMSSWKSVRSEVPAVSNDGQYGVHPENPARFLPPPCRSSAP
eukprot:5817381-Prymnesium_polylepis.1